MNKEYRAVQGEPVVWQCVWPGGGTFTTDSYESAKNYQEGAISSHGEDQAPFIRPLFDAVKHVRGDDYERLQAECEALVEALEELVDLMQGVIVGDYVPDSFTLQPATIALAAHRKQEAV